MAAGQALEVDPEAWKIVDGKLYLSFSKKASQKFVEDANRIINKADDNWMKLKY